MFLHVDDYGAKFSCAPMYLEDLRVGILALKI